MTTTGTHRLQLIQYPEIFLPVLQRVSHATIAAICVVVIVLGGGFMLSSAGTLPVQQEPQWRVQVCVDTCLQLLSSLVLLVGLCCTYVHQQCELTCITSILNLHAPLYTVWKLGCLEGSSTQHKLPTASVLCQRVSTCVAYIF